jgi:hypothetical protein
MDGNESNEKRYGYDISAYREVHPDYGTLADFRHFVREAHARSIRIITGTLAAVVCQTAKGSRFKIALQVLLCPVTDIAANKQVAPRVRGGIFPRRTLVAPRH